jgi:membrane fusion protein (multidrug efflux system)
MRNIKIHAIPVRKGRAAFYIGNGSISGNNISSHLSLRFFLPLIMGISLISCSNKNKSGAAGAYGKLPPASVTVYMATPAIHQITERFPGTLIANSIVQLRPDVTGYLEAIRVPDGSFVKRGQVLYEIDKSRYQAAYNQAQANLQQVQADLSQKQRDLERYQDLLKHDAIARQVVDQANTAVETSKANVAAAKAALDRAATDLDHAVIRAPMSGRIGIVQAKVGDIINAGQTVLNTIVNDNPMYVDFDVPQWRYSEFSRNTSLHRKYYLQLADSSLYPEAGKLLVINNVVDPSTGTIRVRLEFPNSKGALKSGMNAVVVIQHPSDSNALAIPTKALIQTLNETSVYTVGSENVVQVKQVVPGPQLDSLTLIEKGLLPGDKIIVNGLQKARPGDTVRIVNGQQPAGK